MIKRLFPRLACLIFVLLAVDCSWAIQPAYFDHHMAAKEKVQALGYTPTLGTENLPVLMVNIQDDSSAKPTLFTPYRGALARSPYLGILAMICAWLLPFGILIVTAGTVIDFRLSHRTRQD